MPDGPYNEIQLWKYCRLPSIFGDAISLEVRIEGELESALKAAQDHPEHLVFVESPSATDRFLGGARAPRHIDTRAMQPADRAVWHGQVNTTQTPPKHC